MRLRVVKIGRVVYPELKTLAAMYEERLVPLAKVEGHEVKDDDAALKLLGKKGVGQRWIALDERGRTFTSRDFAEKLRAYTDDPAVKELTFVIGGPMRLPPVVREDADLLWSLSPATFTSDMAWLLCWEQLYRAASILKGTGYHHD